MSNSLGQGIKGVFCRKPSVGLSYRGVIPFKTILNAESGYLRGDVNPSKEYHGNEIFFKIINLCAN